ncbi:MAG: hypothetical protein A4E58_00031 [Syntrophorhabdus sp. PtaB.Bin006]|nr:MAG: hypothetical protein A4E58_00031 [Syntrophorhabdus sp. PtaB.Bin006]
MKVRSRRPVRSKNRSTRTVEKPKVKDNPFLLERTYARATSPILAGSTLLTKRPISRAMKVSRNLTPLPVMRDHRNEHRVTARPIKARGTKRNLKSALLSVNSIS